MYFQDKQKFYIAKISSFDPPGESGVVEGGVAEIVAPSEYEHLCRDFLKKRLETPSDAVKKVRFHRSKMFHLGNHLGKADLRFLFSKHSYGSNVLFCRIRALDEAEVKDDIKHEMEVGWRASDNHVTHLDLTNGYVFHPAKKEDSLLLPTVFWSRYHRLQALDLLALEGFDVKDYLDVVQGRVSYEDRLKGVVGQDDLEQFAFGRTTDLIGRPSIRDPKKKASIIPGNAVVSMGTITLENRAKDCEGEKAVFENTAVSIFGFKLEKANLAMFLSQNEPVWCKTVKNEGKANFWNKFKVTEMFVGSPYKADQTVESMSEVERAKFLLYLDSKDLTVAKFFDAVRSSQNEEKPFLPFRTEEIAGIVIGLDRDIKKDKQVNGGIIKVQDGPMKGQLAIFNRNNVWCMGRNMGRGDLTHLILEGQQVSIQVVHLRENNIINKATTVHLLSNIGGGASITLRAKTVTVWLDKQRPGQANKVVNKNSHAEFWLQKRGLSWADFEKLVEGTLPAVPNALATRRKSNMLQNVKDKKAWEVEKKMEKARAEKEGLNPKKLELTTKKNRDSESGASAFRHGPVAEKLCDVALSVSGPGDPAIRKMIKNDEQAQMAFHMYKALELAVDAYKKGRRPSFDKGRRSDGFGNYAKPEQVAAPWAQQQQQQQPHTMMITRTIKQEVAPPQHMGPQQGVNPWGGGSVIQIPPRSSWGGGGMQSTAAPLRMPQNAGGGGGMGYGGRGGGGGGPRGMKRQSFQANGGGGGPKKRKFNQGGRNY